MMRKREVQRGGERGWVGMGVRDGVGEVAGEVETEREQNVDFTLNCDR